MSQEAVLEARFYAIREKYGVDDPRTLEAFFEVFDLWSRCLGGAALSVAP